MIGRRNIKWQMGYLNVEIQNQVISFWSHQLLICKYRQLMFILIQPRHTSPFLILQISQSSSLFVSVPASLSILLFSFLPTSFSSLRPYPFPLSFHSSCLQTLVSILSTLLPLLSYDISKYKLGVLLLIHTIPFQLFLLAWIQHFI